MKPRKILIIQLRQLGDIVLTTPIARFLKKQGGNTEISFLCHPMGKLVLAHNPYIDHHYYYPAKSKLSELSLALKLRRENFDEVYDFMGNPRSGFYSLMTGAKKRVAFFSSRRFLYTYVVPRLKKSCYIVQEKFKLLGVENLSDEQQLLDLKFLEDDMQFVTPFLKSLYSENRPLICLSPTHRHSVRRWKDEYWVELARYLISEKNAVIVWIWGPGEEEFIDQLMALIVEKTYKAPPTTFEQMTALFSKMDMFIGTSNGPSHAAVASGTSTLQLHGPTQGPAWCPPRKEHAFVQGGELLGGSMDMISIGEVIDSFESLYKIIKKP